MAVSNKRSSKKEKKRRREEDDEPTRLTKAPRVEICGHPRPFKQEAVKQMIGSHAHAVTEKLSLQDHEGYLLVPQKEPKPDTDKYQRLKTENLREITYKEFFEAIQGIKDLEAEYGKWSRCNEIVKEKSRVTGWEAREYTTRIKTEVGDASDVAKFMRRYREGENPYLYLLWRHGMTLYKAYGLQKGTFCMWWKEYATRNEAKADFASEVYFMQKDPNYERKSSLQLFDKQLGPETKDTLHELVQKNKTRAVKEKINWLIHNDRGEEINAMKGEKTPLEIAMAMKSDKSQKMAIDIMDGVCKAGLSPNMERVVYASKDYEKIQALMYVAEFELENSTLKDLYTEGTLSLRATLVEKYPEQVPHFAPDVTRDGRRRSRRKR